MLSKMLHNHLKNRIYRYSICIIRLCIYKCMYISIYFVFIANTGMAKTETREWHTSHEYAMNKCETRIIWDHAKSRYGWY